MKAEIHVNIVTDTQVFGRLRDRLSISVQNSSIEGRVGDEGWTTTFTVEDKKVILEDEIDGCFIYPRELFSPKELEEAGYTVKDLRTCKSPMNPKVKKAAGSITLREGTQEEAFEACKGKSGHLVLAPGKGKTVMALKIAGSTGKPFLVFVHNGNVFAQWEERVKEHLPGAKIGQARSSFKTWKWQDRDVVIATFQSFEAVYSRHLVSPVPGFEEFLERFEYVVFDEAHHVKARTFSVATRAFPCKRLALTATPLQLGYESIAYSHVGPILFQDTESDLIPTVFFHKIQLPNGHPAHKLKSSGTALQQLTSSVLGSESKGMTSEYLDAVGKKLWEKIEEGRNVIIMSSRVNPGFYLRDNFLPELGLLHGGVPNDLRDGILHSSPAVYATEQIGREALDRKELDTLFILVPYSDGQLAENNFNQGAGRVLRYLPGKMDPEVHVFYPSGEVALNYARKTYNLALRLKYPCIFKESESNTYHKIRRARASSASAQVEIAEEPAVTPAPVSRLQRLRG